MKTINSKSLLKKQLSKKEFRKEYELLEEEFLIAKEVIRLRLEANLTQKELAEKIGTSQPAIARLESGSYKNLSLSFLNRVGRALGTVPVLYFKKIS
ncbi:MAG: helix-turn-helix domain-containing protein [Leptospiraceae bacterium]|nr:helix-turn-helix domain-containing protein [Leptospiraceae bacterium]